MATSNADLNWIANYIWGIADDVNLSPAPVKNAAGSVRHSSL